MKNKIKVLLAEDSPVVQLLLAHILNADPDIQVVGCVPDGAAAVRFVKEHKPDIVVMDAHMPVMDGFEATRSIMQATPLPIVICSATAKTGEVELAFRALEMGAVASVSKPTGIGHPDFASASAQLLQMIKDIAHIHRPSESATPQRAASPPTNITLAARPIRLIVIGASTGGPAALRTILAGLPPDFQTPIVVVQHIQRGFVEGMVDWLRKTTGRNIQLAKDTQHLESGTTYIAPDGNHLGIGPNLTIRMNEGGPDDTCKPAVAFLFRTAAEYCGPGVAAVLLSGMGGDGAIELKLLRDHGALTIVQDRASSLVYGMPGEAIRHDGAQLILSPDQIAVFLSACDHSTTNPNKTT